MQRNNRINASASSRRFANRIAYRKWYSFDHINLAQGRDSIFAQFPADADTLFNIEYCYRNINKGIIDIDLIPSANPKGWDEFNSLFEKGVVV